MRRGGEWRKVTDPLKGKPEGLGWLRQVAKEREAPGVLCRCVGSLASGLPLQFSVPLGTQGGGAAEGWLPRSTCFCNKLSTCLRLARAQVGQRVYCSSVLPKSEGFFLLVRGCLSYLCVGWALPLCR